MGFFFTLDIHPPTRCSFPPNSGGVVKVKEQQRGLSVLLAARNKTDNFITMSVSFIETNGRGKNVLLRELYCLAYLYMCDGEEGGAFADSTTITTLTATHDSSTECALADSNG